MGTEGSLLCLRGPGVATVREAGEWGGGGGGPEFGRGPKMGNWETISRDFGQEIFVANLGQFRPPYFTLSIKPQDFSVFHGFPSPQQPGPG